VLGVAGAAHEESAPGAAHLLVSRLSCSVAGTRQRVQIVPGTLAHRIYGVGEVGEAYRCSYGLNPAYRARLVAGGIVVSGTGAGGEARIVELPRHPFFIATLFLPQLSSRPGAPHPLIDAFLAAAQRFRERAPAQGLHGGAGAAAGV
jgi:CTP synthase (UTP-ammonia lyase)